MARITVLFAVLGSSSLGALAVSCARGGNRGPGAHPSHALAGERDRVHSNALPLSRQPVRNEAVALGTSTKASSVAELIGATPEDDTVADALRGKVVVRGRTLDVKTMSAGAIAEETKRVRTRKSKRGRGVSEADRKRVATLAKSLRALGLTATVGLKAGLMNREAKIVIVAPLSELHALGKSLARG